MHVTIHHPVIARGMTLFAAPLSGRPYNIHGSPPARGRQHVQIYLSKTSMDEIVWKTPYAMIVI